MLGKMQQHKVREKVMRDGLVGPKPFRSENTSQDVKAGICSLCWFTGSGWGTELAQEGTGTWV